MNVEDINFNSIDVGKLLIDTENRIWVIDKIKKRKKQYHLKKFWHNGNMFNLSCPMKWVSARDLELKHKRVINDLYKRNNGNRVTIKLRQSASKPESIKLRKNSKPKFNLRKNRG